MTKHWKNWLGHEPQLRGHLTAYDFDAPLRVRFETGTVMDFDAGFYTREVDEDGHEMVVLYTEHHGYYVYPANGIEHIEGRDATEYIERVRDDGTAAERGERRSRWFTLSEAPLRKGTP